jgi:hypothetical protein
VANILRGQPDKNIPDLALARVARAVDSLLAQVQYVP